MYSSLKLGHQILEDIKNKEPFYPPVEAVFKAFELTPKDNVKVVLMGQDPYYNQGEANGLAFSVNEGVKWPPSLKNLLRLLESDLGIKRDNPDLSGWAKEGILLLNTALTVKPKTPESHLKMWNPFLKSVMSELSQKEKLIWVLMGNKAKKLNPLISKSHIIIETVHPSPLSAHRGFFESQLFTKIQNALKKQRKTLIDFNRVD